MPSAEGLIFLNENFGFGLMSKIRLWSYTDFHFCVHSFNNFFPVFLECLAGQMEINSLSTVPMYFVSPVANSSLAYSNIMAEWLSGTVYIFQECHKKLLKTSNITKGLFIYSQTW